MNKTGPIILIDDDNDDLEIYKETIETLNLYNKILTFNSSSGFLDYLKTSDEKPFVILCDINMPIMNGLQLRKSMSRDSSLSMISIPFIFLSTSASADHIFEAYTDPIQGYFVKPTSMNEISDMFRRIFEYWAVSKHPKIGISQ